VNETARFEETRAEMDRLARAICGDPSLVSGGARSDFGYVGDVGALPPNLDALAANPGGYTTWRGPYVADRFSSGGPSDWFKYDGWGKAYTYTGGLAINSTGGPAPLSRELAGSMADLLYNRVVVVVTDLDQTPPGPDYADSIRLALTFPDGAGGLTTRLRSPGPDGLVEFDSIPIGGHALRIIYSPASDTLTRQVSVSPGEDAYLETATAEDYWTGS
jgi:hypothetical protein